MRVDNHTHIRHIMLYHFEKGWKASQSFRDLNELFGEGTISESRCREWFARFKSGDTSLEDKPRRGRPSDFDDQALLAAVEENESLTTRMLADDFNVNHSTIVRRLKKLGKNNSSKMPKTKDLSDSDSDSGPEDRLPPPKKKKVEKKPEKKPTAKSSGSGDQENMFQLSKMRYATVSEFRGKVMVGIREYYEADGELRPGRKGISLNLEQWKRLKDSIPEIEEAIQQY